MVKEGTDEKTSLEKVLFEMKLAAIIDECDEHLYTTVKCPQECLEFLHKTGYFPFNLLYEMVCHNLIYW